MVEKAVAALPDGIERVYLRCDSALYEHELMGLAGRPCHRLRDLGRHEPATRRLHRRPARGTLAA